MDKNIAALLREDARTVHVVFDGDASVDLGEPGPRVSTPEGLKFAPGRFKSYTYVTHLSVEIGDQVLVHARNEVKVVRVTHVDDVVKIEPNSPTEYKWVIAKVDMAAHEANLARNFAITAAVSDAYRNNLRRSFAAQILSGVPEDQRLAIENLLKPGVTPDLG